MLREKNRKIDISTLRRYAAQHGKIFPMFLWMEEEGVEIRVVVEMQEGFLSGVKTPNVYYDSVLKSPWKYRKNSHGAKLAIAAAKKVRGEQAQVSAVT